MNSVTLSAPRLACLLVLLGFTSAFADAPLLERDILPLLTKQCMGCHGGLKQKGGLDLRTLPSMLKGGDEGPAVVAGNLDASPLWLQVAEDEMPKGKKALSREEKAILRQWIEKGLPTVAGTREDTDLKILTGDEPHSPLEVASAIDRYIEDSLLKSEIPMAPLAEDDEFLRRVYLDLTGRVPTAEQARQFLNDKGDGKRERLIDTLLGSEQFGVQFGRVWRDWVAPPELPSDANSGTQPITQTRKLGNWFADRFNSNTSWDVVVRELLGVEGEVNHHPQLIFYGLAGQSAKSTPEGSASTVSSLFLGVQMQCAQCHDDPYKDWSQKQFWSLAAFFKNVKGDFGKINESKTEGVITIPKSAFKNSGTQVPVSFLEGEGLDEKKVSKWRPVLLDWMTARENPFFSRAFANRLWFYLFSKGIVNPVDDLRELNPPSHPDLLELLDREFRASGYDIKHLFRCLCNSAAYQRTSRVGTEISSEEVKVRQQAMFGRAPVRVMTADMLLESLKQAYGDPKLDLRDFDKKDGNGDGESAPIGDPYLQFHRDFGTNEEDSTDFTHGIPQMLAFINHPRLRESSAALESFLKTEPTPGVEAVVDWLYLATLSRFPDSDERSEAVAFVRDGEDQSRSYRDVLWMLVNRSEFICVR